MQETELSEHLTPIRYMFLAQVMFSVFECGLYDELKNRANNTIPEMANRLGFSSYRLEGLLFYLKNEGIVEINETGSPKLSSRGLQMGVAKPWYQLLVGGYGQTISNLEPLLKKRSTYGKRRDEFIGVGSCGISRFDALPMAKELIVDIDDPLEYLVDIGCGDGSYLIDLCEEFPNLKGIGIEPSDVSSTFAKNLVKSHKLSNRIQIKIGSFDLLTNLMNIGNHPVFVIAFVLQEVLEQSGRPHVVSVLETIKKNYPKGKVVVIEVDRAELNEDKMSSPLGLGYYNPYFLIHRVTEQRLESPEFWHKVFSEAGWQLSKTVFPRKDYDSLQLKMGFLLE